MAGGCRRAPLTSGQSGETAGPTGSLWVQGSREEHPQGCREPSVLSDLHGDLSETHHQGARRKRISTRDTEVPAPDAVTAKLSAFLTLSRATHEVYCW